jgi:3-methyladenine DNA glycosylase AlkC
LVQSDDPNLRRFVSETLRPVVENKWLYKDINYSLSILRHLFKEPRPYPRASVGNNLSDIARLKPELVYELVAELVAMNNRNATPVKVGTPLTPLRTALAASEAWLNQVTKKE